MMESKQLKEATLFSGLSEKQLNEVIGAGEERAVAEGELIFKEGDAGDETFLLLDGRVQISIEMGMDSEQAPVHTVTAGGVFGEFTLVESHERSASARVVKDASLFVLSRQTFKGLVAKDPLLGYTVLEALSQILVRRLVKTTRSLRASLMF